MERPRHTRSMGGSAALGRGPGAGGVGAAGQGGAGVSEGEEEEDAVSVMTADEDAFDVTEPFDEGVDYGILDEPDATIGGPESGPAGAAAKGRRVTGSGRLAASAKAAAAGAEAGSVHKSALDAARASVTGMGGAASSVCEELEEDECLEEEDDDEGGRESMQYACLHAWARVLAGSRQTLRAAAAHSCLVLFVFSGMSPLIHPHTDTM